MITFLVFRAAAMTLRTVLLSIQSLLCDPQPNDPQDAVVANQYLSNIELFKKTALYWAQHFAKGEKSLLIYSIHFLEITNTLFTLCFSSWYFRC